MKLKTDNRKNKIDVDKLEFKEKGVIIHQTNGDSDLYSYSWLFKQNCEVEK